MLTWGTSWHQELTGEIFFTEKSLNLGLEASIGVYLLSKALWNSWINVGAMALQWHGFHTENSEVEPIVLRYDQSFSANCCRKDGTFTWKYQGDRRGDGHYSLFLHKCPQLIYMEQTDIGRIATYSQEGCTQHKHDLSIQGEPFPW